MFIKGIDYESCDNCLACEKICTNSRVISHDETGKPEYRYDYKCIYCGHCLAICPKKAISFRPLILKPGTTYISESLPVDPAEKMPDENLIRNLLASIRTNRYFSDKPVDPCLLRKVLDAMVRAPSAGNEQKKNFLVLTDREKLDELEQLVKEFYRRSLLKFKNPIFANSISLISTIKARKNQASSNTDNPGSPGNPGKPEISFMNQYRFFKNFYQHELIEDNARLTYAKNAPAVIFLTSKSKEHTHPAVFAKGDASIAVTYGIVMAKVLGLATCWMGLAEIAANKDKNIRRILKISESERLDAAVAIGYSDLDWKQVPPRGPVKVTWQTAKD